MMRPFLLGAMALVLLTGGGHFLAAGLDMVLKGIPAGKEFSVDLFEERKGGEKSSKTGEGRTKPLFQTSAAFARGIYAVSSVQTADESLSLMADWPAEARFARERALELRQAEQALKVTLSERPLDVRIVEDLWQKIVFLRNDLGALCAASTPRESSRSERSVAN